MEEKISRQSDLKINKFMNEKQGEGIKMEEEKIWFKNNIKKIKKSENVISICNSAVAGYQYWGIIQDFFVWRC